jgi:hypothetical protein
MWLRVIEIRVQGFVDAILADWYTPAAYGGMDL